MRLQRANLGEQGLWLLTITWSGQVYRWSSYPTSPRNGDGDEIAHDGGLDLGSWTQTIEILSANPSQRSVSVKITFPVDVAERIESGASLDTATGELSYYLEGQTYEQRLVVLKGRVTSPEYGAAGEPVSMSIRQEPYDDAVLIPAASKVASSATWSTCPDDSEGDAYPEVFGQPGSYYDGSAAAVSGGSPAVVVAATGSSADTLLIAGHHVEASSVQVIDDSDVSESFAVVNSYDDLSQPVAVVDVSGAVSIDRTSGDFWVAWDGGRARPEVTGAGTLMLFLLRISGMDYDEDATAAAAPALDGYEIGGYIVEPCTAWEYIQDHILPILPVSIAAGQDGIYPIVWPTEIRPNSSVSELKVTDMDRAEPVVYETEVADLVNEIRLSYAKGGRQIVYSGEQQDSEQAVASFGRYGTRALELTTEVVWADQTAQLIAANMIALKSLPTRSLIYHGSPKDLAWLRPGQVVSVTDPELHLDKRLVLVRSVTFSTTGAAGVELLIVEGLDR